MATSVEEGAPLAEGEPLHITFNEPVTLDSFKPSGDAAGELATSGSHG